MLAWLLANLGTIVVSLILILIVAGIIYSMIRNKKMGKSSCGCGCAGCNKCASMKHNT